MLWITTEYPLRHAHAGSAPIKQIPALLRLAAVGMPASAARRRTASLCRPPSGKAHCAAARAEVRALGTLFADFLDHRVIELDGGLHSCRSHQHMQVH